jgi:hypothetical protein
MSLVDRWIRRQVALVVDLDLPPPVSALCERIEIVKHAIVSDP